MSEDNFEPFLRTALLGRIRRLYDQIYGRGALRAMAQRKKAEVRAEAEAALDRDRAMERHMEDQDDGEATNGAHLHQLLARVPIQASAFSAIISCSRCP